MIDVREIEDWNSMISSVEAIEIHSAEQAAVLASGPSLSRYQEAAGGGMTIITVNRSLSPSSQYHIAPSADVLLDVLAKLHVGAVIVTTAQIFSRDSRPALKALRKRGRFMVAPVNPSLFLKFKMRLPISAPEYEQIDLSQTCYLPGASAGVMATAFALAAGASRIHQFGMDGWTQFVSRGMSPYADGTNWSGEKRGDDWMHYQEQLVRNGLLRCAKFAREKGATIVNHSPTSQYREILSDVVSQ